MATTTMWCNLYKLVKAEVAWHLFCSQHQRCIQSSSLYKYTHGKLVHQNYLEKVHEKLLHGKCLVKRMDKFYPTSFVPFALGRWYTDLINGELFHFIFFPFLPLYTSHDNDNNKTTLSGSHTYTSFKILWCINEKLAVHWVDIFHADPVTIIKSE